MQTIQNAEWTELTGLSEGNIYILQASGQGRNTLELVTCYWSQCETKPQNLECDFVVSDTIKIKAGAPVYVKSSVYPICVRALKVEE